MFGRRFYCGFGKTVSSILVILSDLVLCVYELKRMTFGLKNEFGLNWDWTKLRKGVTS